jgi:hypothetical protein
MELIFCARYKDEQDSPGSHSHRGKSHLGKKEQEIKGMIICQIM